MKITSGAPTEQLCVNTQMRKNILGCKAKQVINRQKRIMISLYFRHKRCFKISPSARKLLFKTYICYYYFFIVVAVE